MNWTEYKDQVKSSDAYSKKLLESSEAEATIISEMISRQSTLGLSQSRLAIKSASADSSEQLNKEGQ